MALSIPLIAASDDKLQVDIAKELEYGGQGSISVCKKLANCLALFFEKLQPRHPKMYIAKTYLSRSII